MEELLTIFIGKTVSIYTAKFEGTSPNWKRVTITDFPLGVMKAVFLRGKSVNVNICGNLPEDLRYIDYPLFNALLIAAFSKSSAHFCMQK